MLSELHVIQNHSLLILNYSVCSLCESMAGMIVLHLFCFYSNLYTMADCLTLCFSGLYTFGLLLAIVFIFVTSADHNHSLHCSLIGL